MSQRILKLDQTELARAVRILARRDADLARVVKTYGPPPLWARKPGFATLVYIILEQQVSLASARAAYQRLHSAIAPITPRRFLTLDDTALKAIGFSRQKMAYARQLAEAINARRFTPSALATLDDAAARAMLIQLKGIGVWTADIYLMEALLRPDIWPTGDLALAVATQQVKRLRSRPTPDELESLGEAWRPWRAVAARILWHHYLSERK